MKRSLLFLFILISLKSFSQDLYPTHWWVGMNNPELQLIIHRQNVAHETVTLMKYKGVKVVRQHKMESPNYLLLDLEISKKAKPGKLEFKITNLQSPEAVSYKTFQYELKSRSTENGKTRVLGVNSSDFVYLLMPDRFSNGDPSNDRFTDLRDTDLDRNDKYARHGGDCKGVVNKLDYLKDMGVTTIWCTPLIENDMPRMKEVGYELAGFHGYWFTDHYKIDKRYGGNEAYKSMIAAAHSKGLKVIHDAVYNHVGLYHWMNLDPPAKDWINQWPEFTPPNHRDAAVFDPHGSVYDNTNMLKGWFVRHLPDLNLANTYVANYLIQNAIWLVEEFGFDGFRVDTYKYCDEQFLNNVNAALLDQYPTVTTFVEAWGHDVAANAYFVQNTMDLPFNHNAMGALDFPLCEAIHNSLTRPAEWTGGINALYLTLAEDFLYKDPMKNCLFLDNHDMNRFFSVVGEDLQKFKAGMALLLTMRGIPQLYYGDEILMKNFKNPTDQEVRLDFPGGWAGDPVNKFQASGRTKEENEAFEYIKTLANYRKKSTAIGKGKLMQYIPQNAVYTYFRYDDQQTVMVMMNTGNETRKVNTQRFNERTDGFTSVKNIITGQVLPLDQIELKPWETFVGELVK